MAQKFVLAINKDVYRQALKTKDSKIVPDLRFGNVTYHKDLIEDGEFCLGGGDYEIIEDNGKKNVVLSGQSFDYGLPRWAMIDGITSDVYIDGTIVYKYPNDFQYKDCEDINVKKLFYLK